MIDLCFVCEFALINRCELLNPLPQIRVLSLRSTRILPACMLNFALAKCQLSPAAI